MYIPLKEQAKIEGFLNAINAGEKVVFHPRKILLLIFISLFLFTASIFYWGSLKSQPAIILAISFLFFVLTYCIRVFTQDGLLILNSQGLTYFNYWQEKHYAWHQINSISYRSTRFLSYLYIKLKENGKLKQIGCYSSYKEISLLSLKEVLNRKIQESATNKEL